MITAQLEYGHQALNGSGSILSPGFYYPASHTLGYSDALLTYQILYHWFRQANWDVFSSFQFCVLISNFLNYAICFLVLNRGFRIGALSSALGAFFFAFNCPKFNQTGHAQLQCLFWLPLLVWCVVMVFRNSKTLTRWKAFLLLSAAATILNFQFLTVFYPAWFFVFWTFLFLVLSFGKRETRTYLLGIFRKFKPAIGGALLVFLAGSVPFSWVYLPVLSKLGGKSYTEVNGMIPGISSFLWMGPRHGWWGWIWDSCRTIRELPVEVEERMGFGLAVEAAWIVLSVGSFSWILRHSGGKPLWIEKLFKNNKGAVHFQFLMMAILAIDLFVLLGLKYGDYSPWHFVYSFFPGASAIRAVSRYVLFLMLPIAVVIAYGCERLLEKIGRMKDGFQKLGLVFFTFLWIAMAVFEQVNLPPYPAFSKSMELQRLEYLSEKLPASCQLFYVTADPVLPLTPDFSATNIQIDAMLISAVRGIPTLNGYSGHSPENWDLYKVRSPKYRQYVSDWMKLNGLAGPLYRLNIDR